MVKKMMPEEFKATSKEKGNRSLGKAENLLGYQELCLSHQKWENCGHHDKHKKSWMLASVFAPSSSFLLLNIESLFIWTG